MYKICICDDEAIFLDKIHRITQNFFDAKVDADILTFSNSSIFADNIPYAELYLLDVKMPEVSGMELARKIRSMDSKCSIIFISSLYEPVLLLSNILLCAIFGKNIWMKNFPPHSPHFGK